MLKPLLILLVIVILIAVGVNSDLFNTSEDYPSEISPLVEKSIKKNEKIKKTIKEETFLPRELSVKKENKESLTKIEKEIQKLFQEAYAFYRKHQDKEALLVLNKIIKQTKSSSNSKMLKLFANACNQKAYLYQRYPRNDIDEAIESYQEAIDILKESNNTIVLNSYIDTQLAQSTLFPREEQINIYDELIERLENDKEHRFDKKIENLLFDKSFKLMGIDDEGAMEALDKILDNYKQTDGTVKLPPNIEFSILNNIELSIITNNDDSKYQELAEEYLSQSPETKPLLDMLNIIKNAQELDQKEAFQEWQEEHKDYNFPGWSFREIKKWMSSIEDPSQRQRVEQYIQNFEKQKYNRSSKGTPYPPVYPAPTDNSEEKVVEVEYGDPIVYEPDSYIQDMNEGSTNPYYSSDPYANDIPQESKDRVVYDSSTESIPEIIESYEGEEVIYETAPPPYDPE